ATRAATRRAPRKRTASDRIRAMATCLRFELDRKPSPLYPGWTGGEKPRHDTPCHDGAMTRRASTTSVLLALVLAGALWQAVHATAPLRPTAATQAVRGKSAIASPSEAWDVLAEVRARHGQPPPGYVGGRAFQNREGRLPRGTYREFDVHPKVPGQPRDAA